jgi:hypothetical protein
MAGAVRAASTQIAGVYSTVPLMLMLSWVTQEPEKRFGSLSTKPRVR